MNVKRERIVYWLIIAVIVIVAVVGIPMAVRWGMKPRCYACNHFRHEHRMCGWMGEGMGTCICEKDK